MFKVLFFILLLGFLSVVISSCCTLGSLTNALEVDILAMETCRSSYACGHKCSCGKTLQFNLDTASDSYLDKVNNAVCLGKGSSHVVDPTSRAVRMQASLKGLSSSIRTDLVDTFYNNPTTNAAIITYMETYQVSTGLRIPSPKPSSKGVVRYRLPVGVHYKFGGRIYVPPQLNKRYADHLRRRIAGKQKSLITGKIFRVSKDKANRFRSHLTRTWDFNGALKKVGISVPKHYDNFFTSLGKKVPQLQQRPQVQRWQRPQVQRWQRPKPQRWQRPKPQRWQRPQVQKWQRPQVQKWQRPHIQRRGWGGRGRWLLEAEVEEETNVMTIDDDDEVAINVGNILSDDDEAEALGFFSSIGRFFSNIGRAIVRVVKAIVHAVVNLFDPTEVKKALNDMISAQDVNTLVSLYSQNIENFYVDFENLCQLKKDPDATITAMENLMIQKTNQETFNVIKKILAKISTKTTNDIVSEFQQTMAPVRQKILNTFEALYNNVTTLCQCQDMINAAPSLGVPQSHITQLSNDIESLCDEACVPTPVAPPAPKPSLQLPKLKFNLPVFKIPVFNIHWQTPSNWPKLVEE